MRILSMLAMAAVLSAPVAAQRHKLDINAETPEGQLLQQIGTEQDEAKKAALLEEFTTKYPKHEAAAWAYSALQPLYIKQGKLDQAMAVGEKLLALDPADAQTALATLKAAEAKKDAALIRKYSDLASQVSRKAASAPKPQEADEAEEWRVSVDFAKQVDTYSEYSLYAAALQSTDAAQIAALVETLEARNPQSQYLAQAQGPYFRALVQSRNADKATAVAEKLIAAKQADEDMLLTAADYHFNKKQNPEKVIEYARQAAEVIGGKAKPEGIDDAAWQSAKNTKLGLANWYVGMQYAAQNKFAEADTALRAALPLVESNEGLKAAALFNLGLANYRLGSAAKGPAQTSSILDALRFSQQCAAMKSPFQGAAAQNVKAIRTQYSIK